MHWIVIYLVDSAIQLLNNSGQDITLSVGDLRVHRVNKNLRDYAYCFLEKYIFLTINIKFSDNSFLVAFFFWTLEFANGI